MTTTTTATMTPAIRPALELPPSSEPQENGPEPRHCNPSLQNHSSPSQSPQNVVMATSIDGDGDEARRDEDDSEASVQRIQFGLSRHLLMTGFVRTCCDCSLFSVLSTVHD